jgi:hypothetical protein
MCWKIIAIIRKLKLMFLYILIIRHLTRRNTITKESFHYCAFFIWRSPRDMSLEAKKKSVLYAVTARNLYIASDRVVTVGAETETMLDYWTVTLFAV